MSQTIAEIILSDLSADHLRIGGFTPMTTIDFPGELAAVLFLQGCGFRCQYCHNGHLADVKAKGQIAWSSIREFLQSRQGFLDAIVFSGGEPTVQQALLPAIDEVKSQGFKVGLHTTGVSPLMLAKVLPKLDWVGFDIKGLVEDYANITGVDAGSKCWQSLRLLLNSGVDYEVRTTVHWDLIPADKLLKIGLGLQEEGVDRFVVQNCNTDHCLNPELGPSVLDDQAKSQLWQQLEQYFSSFAIR